MPPTVTLQQIANKTCDPFHTISLHVRGQMMRVLDEEKIIWIDRKKVNWKCM